MLNASPQAHVLMRNGIEPDGVHVMHLNKEVRNPDVCELLELTDVTDDVRACVPNLSEIVRRLEMFDGPLPSVEIGCHCGEPWSARFRSVAGRMMIGIFSPLYDRGPATFPIDGSRAIGVSARHIGRREAALKGSSRRGYIA